VDPLTLFALANGAVASVKAGCKLYKDIKGAAGEVKEVIKDLDSQFHKMYQGKDVPSEATRQLKEEKVRVVELNKRANAGEHTGIYQEIGEHLGTYYDNLHKCIAIFEEEERRSRSEIYKGDTSLGKRALQRVLMRKQLEQMGTELQELMIYQSPPELGALWTDVNSMMKKMEEEQKILIISDMRKQALHEKRREARMKKIRDDAMVGIFIIVIIFTMGGTFMWVAYDRQQKYPQYGNELIPKNPDKKEEKYIYIGR
jgi:hypothetical protein